jgi:hypothetical protein
LKPKRKNTGLSIHGVFVGAAVLVAGAAVVAGLIFRAV